MKKKKAEQQRSKTPTFVVPGARGVTVYKKKEDKKEMQEEEETKRQAPIYKTTGPKWEKKEDRLKREEAAEQRKVQRQQTRTRGMLNRIFRKVTDDGIAEDELADQIEQQFKAKLLGTAKRNISRRRGQRGGNANATISEEAEQRMAEEAKTLAGEVMEAMKHGFLANEYEVDLSESGMRTFKQKPEEPSDVEMDKEHSKEVDEMAEKFHSFGSGNSFKLEDVKQYFSSADATLVKKLCHDLRHDVFSDLFIVTKEQVTGEFLFVRKSTN